MCTIFFFFFLLLQNLKLSAQMNADGGSSPMVPLKGDKQVEYLDLDLDPGKSTPSRKVCWRNKCRHGLRTAHSVQSAYQVINELFSLLVHQNGTGAAVSDERVDYVVVDQQRTLALKSTREAWTDGRQSTESETQTKGPK